MATQTRPPVIPEIAKAYQNDPSTILALAAMKNGTSTAPVAAGNYGYVDGIARVLQGLAGHYADQKKQEQYSKDEAAKVARMNAMGVANTTAPVSAGAATGAVAAPPLLRAPSAPVAPSVPPGGPQAAPAIAAALGAPPPPDPTAAPPQAPAQGGGPMGRIPFSGNSSAAAAPSAAPPVPPPAAPVLGGPAHVLTPPAPETVPAAPAPVARPVAPAAVGPTRSKLLDAAYKLMATGDAYDYAPAQEMYMSGLGDQTKLDESAAERQQRIADMGYQTDNSIYANAASQDRGADLSEVAAVRARNAKAAQDAIDRTFQGGEKSLDRQNAIKLEQMRADSAMAVARQKEKAQEDALLDPDTLKQMAAQAWAGDKSVFSGLGRGANGARNTIALRKATYDYGLANGKNGADLAAMNAQFAGVTRAASAAGQRVGAAEVSVAELPKLTALSSEAYSKLPRGQFVPFNELQRLVSSKTSSPEQAQAYAADNAVINAYARALSPTGQPHQADKERAVEMLNGAYSHEAHQAVLEQINRETQAIKEGASEALVGSPGASGGKATGGVVPRKPGETPAQYLKRTGG